MYREMDMPCRPLAGRPRWIVGVALHAAILSACTFAPEGGLEPGPDTGPPETDGRPFDATVDRDTIGAVDAAPDADPGPRPRDVVHVPEEGWTGGTTDATWTGDVTIDTSGTPSITGAGTEGLTLRTQAQDPSGPELAILHVGNLTVNDGVDVRVTGSRPLVIISSGSITLNGRIDAGADQETPGAGGAGPRQGAGAGESGGHTDPASDAGGGGGGHATTGARGGTGCPDDPSGGDSCDDPGSAPGAAGGAVYGESDLPVLTGGSGGGRGGAGGDNPCTPGDGGGGGGAVQLYALDTITIGASGGISVGGGGGGGGDSSFCGAAAGGGGGSGGAVYLQAAHIQHDGLLAANGGGGGSGAGGGGEDGSSGSNGALDETPAPGAPDPGPNGGSAGGAGAAAGSDPQDGQELTDEPNGGGGGGAAGRIVLHSTDLAGAGRSSPDAVRIDQ
jgi:hypothetical protein